MGDAGNPTISFKRKNKNEINIEKAVKYLQHYIGTYDDGNVSIYNGDISDKTYIDDMLYGLGVSIDKDKYQFGDGYEKFKEFLKGFLGE